jgi:hypothetical protein
MVDKSAPLGPDIRERVRAYVANAGQLRQTATSISGKVRAHNLGSVTDALEELVAEGQLEKEERPEREPVYSKGLGAWFAAAQAADQPPPARGPAPRPSRGAPPPGRGRPPHRRGR